MDPPLNFCSTSCSGLPAAAAVLSCLFSLLYLGKLQSFLSRGCQQQQLSTSLVSHQLISILFLFDSLGKLQNFLSLGSQQQQLFSLNNLQLISVSVWQRGEAAELPVAGLPAAAAAAGQHGDPQAGPERGGGGGGRVGRGDLTDGQELLHTRSVILLCN